MKMAQNDGAERGFSYGKVLGIFPRGEKVSTRNTPAAKMFPTAENPT